MLETLFHLFKKHDMPVAFGSSFVTILRSVMGDPPSKDQLQVCLIRSVSLSLSLTHTPYTASRALCSDFNHTRFVLVSLLLCLHCLLILVFLPSHRVCAACVQLPHCHTSITQHDGHNYTTATLTEEGTACRDPGERDTAGNGDRKVNGKVNGKLLLSGFQGSPSHAQSLAALPSRGAKREGADRGSASCCSHYYHLLGRISGATSSASVSSPCSCGRSREHDTHLHLEHVSGCESDDALIPSGVSPSPLFRLSSLSLSLSVSLPLSLSLSL